MWWNDVIRCDQMSGDSGVWGLFAGSPPCTVSVVDLLVVTESGGVPDGTIEAIMLMIEKSAVDNTSHKLRAHARERSHDRTFKICEHIVCANMLRANTSSHYITKGHMYPMGRIPNDSTSHSAWSTGLPSSGWGDLQRSYVPHHFQVTNFNIWLIWNTGWRLDYPHATNYICMCSPFFHACLMTYRTYRVYIRYSGNMSLGKNI